MKRPDWYLKGALTAIAIGALATAALLPGCKKSQSSADAASARDLQELAEGLLKYARSHGEKLPPTWNAADA